MVIDLHVHSAFSDGLLSIEALCGLALQLQIHVIALCDHDTLDGLAPMAQLTQAINQHGERLRALPCVELSTGEDGRIHVLGYGANPDSEPLQAAIKSLREKRLIRGVQMVQAMRKLGVDIPAELLPMPAANGMAIGRPHVARALVQMGTVHTMEQAFDRYLGEGKPAYIPLTHLTTVQAIILLRDAGAVPVLAHPMRIGLSPHMLEALLESLQTVGLQGLEVYHPSASRVGLKVLEAMARRHALLVTGGSDFHGDRGARAKLGGLPAGWRAWQADLDALTAAMLEAGAPLKA